MVAVLKSFLVVIMSVLNVFTFPLFGNFAWKNEDKNADDVKMSMAVISDTHMQDSTFREFMLELGLYDIQNSKTQVDALAIDGDITDHGYEEQYEAVKDVLSKYQPAKQILLVQGNHDSWTRNDDNGPTQQDLFIKYNKEIANRDIDNVYYSTNINGYPVIVLGSEYDSTDAYMSDTQIEWFKSEMQNASETGLPIFVLCHWPVNGSHGLPQTFDVFDKDYDDMTGGIGEQSEQIEAVLKQYNNVFYINGHIHAGFVTEKQAAVYGYSTVESEGSFHSINLPCYMYPTILGRVANGTGVKIEVYDNEVLVRARSYSAGVWYTCYDTQIPLV